MCPVLGSDAVDALLIMAEESKFATHLERSQIGELFMLIEAARLPERAVGPNRLSVNVIGMLAGLGFGVAFVAVLGTPKKTSI